jgi:SAM-dependent methyltransferase
MDKRAIAQRSFITTHLQVTNTSTLLDIGCSAGSLLLAFGDRTSNLDGFEPDVTMAGLARDRLPTTARVFNKLCDPAVLPAETYDLITLSHVFEHVLDPVVFLGHLFRAIHPDGFVFIEVPNESVSEVKRQVRAPFRGKLHLSYFNPQTLSRCATAAGGTIAKISTCGPRASEFSLVPNEMLRPRARRSIMTKAYDRVQRALSVAPSPRWIGSIDLGEYMGTDTGSDGIWIRALFSKNGESKRSAAPGRQA